MRTIVLLALMSGFALAAKPVFDVPEAGGYDRAWVTLGVTNDTDKPVKVDKGFCEGLSVAGADGKALKMAQCDDLSGFTLGAGETVTRRFNLITCFPDAATPGNYTVTWKHPAIADADQPKAASIEIVAEYAEIEFDGWGTVFARFWGDKVPKTVANFKKLTNDGFYNGVIFHRIIPRFMMQGGDKNGDGTGDPGYKFDDEPSPIKLTPGVLAMANSGPNTNGSQFFICFVDCPHLDGKHTPFGKVMEGMDVIWKMEREVKLVPKQPNDPKFGKPIAPPVMKKVTWHEKK
jgi:peptidyl-prolyl cis-trans isomerase B (cyclophilin B)